MAGRPLRPATDRRLGGPLPRQQANQTRIHLTPPEFFTPYHAVLCAYAVLAAVSNCYPPVWGRLPTRYSPVRHSVTKTFIRRIMLKCFVRLACVKHAASVHPEPGSNSHKKFFPFQDQLANFNHSSILNVLLFFRLLWLSSLLFSRTHFNANCFAVLNESFKVISLFSYQSSLFVVLATAFIFYQKHLSLSTTFFIFLCCRFKRQLIYIITSLCPCQQLFAVF